MPDSVIIPWEIANTARDPVLESQKGALAGLEIGQKRAQIHALQGFDVNNPDSFAGTTNALAHANALDAAGGIYALQGARLKNATPEWVTDAMRAGE